MTTTIKETSNYLLLEGEGAGKGCFAIRDKQNNSQLDWFCGVEGKKWADRLVKLSAKKFDEAAKAEFDTVY